MSTTKLFQKHFGNTPVVGLNHPNVEAFFDEMNQECIEEDKQKNSVLHSIKQSDEGKVCHCINWHPPIKPDQGKKAKCSNCKRYRHKQINHSA